MTAGSTTRLPELRVRHASMEDLEAVTALERVCFPPAEAADRESFAGRLRVYPECFWLLEEENGRLLSFVDGFATDEPDLTDEMYARPEMHQPAGKWQMIFGVNTHPDYRGRGCATRLLRAAIDEARARGRAGVVLTCKPEKRSFYARLGFEDEGVSPLSTHGGAVWHQMRLRFAGEETDG